MDKYRFSFIDTYSHSNYKLKYDVDGWSSYGVNFGRETGHGDVVKSYTSDFTFIKDDAEYLKDLFFMYGVNRRVLLRVDRLDNAMRNEYKVEYVGQLDFTQLSIGNGSVHVPLIQMGLYVDIDNKYSTGFDVVMDKDFRYTTGYVPQDCTFKYNGNMNICTGPENQQVGIDVFIHQPGLDASYTDDYFSAPSERQFDASSTDSTNDPRYNVSNCFLRCSSDTIYSGLFSTKLQVDIRESYVSGGGVALFVQIFANRGDVNGDQYMQGIMAYKKFVNRIWLNKDDAIRITMADGNVHLLWDVEDVLAFGGYDLVSGVHDGVNLTFGFALTRGGNISTHAAASISGHVAARLRNVRVSGKVRCTSRLSRNSDYVIKCASMKDVFSQIIGSIGGDNDIIIDESYVGDLDAENILLTSSMGMRYKGVLLRDDMGNNVNEYYPDEYKMVTSLKDFLEWVYVVFAYSMKIRYDEDNDNYIVGLYHVSSFYDGNVIDTIDNVDDVVVAPYRDVIYSSIDVGYNVEMVTGAKFDYCTMMNFVTPNTTIEENKLSLISPYNASMYSIESYLKNNYGTLDEEGDDEKDGTIYFMRVEDYNGEKRLLRSSYIVTNGLPNTLSNLSAYNVEFSTKRLLMVHQQEIDSWFAMDENDELVFNTSEGNDSFSSRQIQPVRRAGYPYNMVSADVVECSNVIIGGDRIFKPYIITLNAAARTALIGKIMSNPYGRIVFKYNGVNIGGFLAKSNTAASVNPMHEEPSQFTLIADEGFSRI